MKRQLLDGLIKSTVDGLNQPFKQFYLDSWVIIPYFIWKKNGGLEPQVIYYNVDYVYRFSQLFLSRGGKVGIDNPKV